MFERLAAPKHVPVIHKDEELKWASGGDEDDEDDTAGNEETKQLLIELHNKFVECDEDENGEMDEKEFIGIRDLWLSKVDHKEMTPAQLRHLFLKIDVSARLADIKHLYRDAARLLANPCVARVHCADQLRRWPGMG